MAPITIGFGFLLVGIGLVGWIATGGEHITALIPAFFGLVLGFLGVLARRDVYRKHVMHAAVLIGLIGFLVPTCRMLYLWTIDKLPAQAALIEQVIMAVTCAVFVGLCVKSFIDARRSRTAATEGGQPAGPSSAS